MPESKSSPQTILIADDNPNNLRVLSSMLEEQGYKVRVSQNGEQVLQSVEMMLPDLIMLDIHMPVLDGYEACKKLKSEERYRDIPVIFVSAMSEVFNKLLAFEVGGIDYIEKPFQIEEVSARVRTHLALKNTRDKLKEYERLFEKYKDIVDVTDSDTGELRDQLQNLIAAQEIISDTDKKSDEQRAGIVAIIEAAEKVIKFLGLSLETHSINKTSQMNKSQGESG